MDTWVNDLTHYIAQVPALWAYALLLLAAYLENVCPPVPGDVCIVFAGYLASTGSLNLALVVGLGTISGVLGFMTVFYVGRSVGSRLVASRRVRWINQQALDAVDRWSARFGAGVILLNRFLAAVRSVVALSVGLGTMSASRACILSAIAALIWTLMLATAGFMVGENWEQIRGFIAAYSQAVGIVIVLTSGVAIGRATVRRRKARSDGPGAPPTRL